MNIKELGHVVLYVRSLTRSADFYRDTLGFREIMRKSGLAVFSGGRTHHELLLIEIGDDAPIPDRKLRPGLYHIGFKVGDGHKAIQKAWRELKEKNIPIVGTADHTVTHSIYLHDPDGNELELYADISDEWKTNPEAIMSPTKILHLE